MIIEKTKLDGVLKITPHRFYDDRGFFCETWNNHEMSKQGLDIVFVQDNHSMSTKAWTVRGLHFQSPPYAQKKLVWCNKGAMRDIAVDIRIGSPTYGEWISEELTADNGVQMLIPEGFLHGFVTLVADTEVTYKCSNFYSPENSDLVCYDDSLLAIDWGIPDGVQPTLSERDLRASTLENLDNPFQYKEL